MIDKNNVEYCDVLKKLIELEFNVSEDEASELFGRVADYNIEDASQALQIIKEEFGKKTRWSK